MSDNNLKMGAEPKPAPIFFEIHEKACREGKDHYIDPVTGYLVMTSLFLKNRGYCCENNCCHCPYDFGGLEKKV